MDARRPARQTREPPLETGSVAGNVEHGRRGSPERLIFLHIPKAAGSTLRRVVRRQFPTGDAFTTYIIGDGPGRVRPDGIVDSSAFEDIEKLRRMTEAEKSRIVCILGHTPFGVHEFLPAGFEYITMLRHPIERVISDYYYILRRPTHRLHPVLKARGLSLERYITSGLDPRIENGQVRYLCGMREMDGVFGDGPVDDRALESAKRNLETRIKAFGITERFDESLLVFKHALGWRNVFYESRNVTVGRPQASSLNSEALKAMEERLAYDMELYRFATNLFDRRVREAGIGAVELASFRALNNIHKVFTQFLKGDFSSVFELIRANARQSVASS